MKDLLSKEHYCYKINTLSVESSTVTFFRMGGGGEEGCSFIVKNKLKSEIYKDKKSF